MNKKNRINEIVIGLVAPIGTEKNEFISFLEESFKRKKYDVKKINIMKELLGEELSENKDHIPQSLLTYLKMEFSSGLRTEICSSFMGIVSVLGIIRKREESIKMKKNSMNKSNGVVYLIDQLKHPDEYKLLSKVYGLSYIQLSLYSKFENRDSVIRHRLKNDFSIFNEKDMIFRIKEHSARALICKDNKMILSIYNKIFSIKKLGQYRREILPDASHMIIEKDMSDTGSEYSENKTGQLIKDIFHLSHYFFNLDKNSDTIKNETEKFIDLLFGEYKDYPNQDEFAMALAYHASYRSNFPGRRHVGACILSENGEVISAASIRAPSSSPNTNKFIEDSVSSGYNKIKDRYEGALKWVKEGKHIKKLDTDSDEIKLIKILLRDNIEYHPFTHAEISALSDAAKLGIPVRGATLYTTTFPCHICAKDIVTFGIKKVIYLEQYPKSKNRDLYPNVISIDSEENGKIPFLIYSGIGPKRYHYVYHLDNIQKSLNQDNLTPPNLICEFDLYNIQRENDVIEFINSRFELKFKINNKFKGNKHSSSNNAENQFESICSIIKKDRK